MQNASKAIRDYLLTKAALVALAGTRIYAEANTPPAGYKLSDGGAICFKARGGRPEYVDVLLAPSYQFKCYGTTELTANQLYQALYDALQNAQTYIIRGARCEVLGQTLAEPETGWPFVLTFFKVMVTNA
jgi:hypothetical protein